MARSAFSILGFLLFATFSHAETAELRMRFVYDGDAPAAKRVPINPAAAPPGGPVIDERLLVDPATNGIRNVVVYVYTGRGGSKLDPKPYEGTTRRLEMLNARLDPHVLITRAGDTLKLVNRDAVGHNLNFHFLRNHSRNVAIAAGNQQSFPLPLPEPAPIPIDDNIHPWMKSYLVLLDHSFVAVSEKDGELTIEGLPADKSLDFRVWQEAGRIDRVQVSGKKELWDRGRFRVEFEPGVNDLGDILVPADAFD